MFKVGGEPFQFRDPQVGENYSDLFKLTTKFA